MPVLFDVQQVYGLLAWLCIFVGSFGTGRGAARGGQEAGDAPDLILQNVEGCRYGFTVVCWNNCAHAVSNIGYLAQ